MSEWLLLQAMLHGLPSSDPALAVAMPIGVGALALTGGLTALTIVKAAGIGLLGPTPEQRAAEAHEVGPSMRLGAGILATLCLVFGVAPFLVVPSVVDAARSVTRTRIPDPLVGGWQVGLAGVHGVLAPGLLALALLVAVTLVAGARRVLQPAPARRTEAWGCGRELQTATMEYTATSFGEPLTRVFEDVLRPAHDLDVSHVAESRTTSRRPRFHTSLDDAFERHAYRPASVGLGLVGGPRPAGAERQHPPLPGLRTGGPRRGAGGGRMRTGWPTASMAAVSLLQVVGRAGRGSAAGRADAHGALPPGRPGRPPGSPTPLDLRKLARRERTASDETSWIFPLAPLVLVGSTVVVAAIAPLLATDPAYGWSADLFAVVFLLLLGSVALALGALDSGTAFGGMGASRAMTIGALSEPALLVAILALSVPAHSSNLPAIVTRSLAHPLWLATPERLLALVAFVIVIVAESGRLPVDNPSTHLELTMIHEAMVLEYSGTDLALIKLGESMRLAVLMALFADLFVPWGIATAPGPIHLVVGLATTVAKVAALGVGLAVFEVTVAKLRLFRVPELLAGAFVLSVLAVLSALVVP